MNNQPNNPSAEAGAINERVAVAIHSHKVKLRVLSSIAFLLGFLALVASVALAWSYLIFVLPMQRQMIEDTFVHQSATPPQTNAVTVQVAMERTERIERYLRNDARVTQVMSMGTWMLGVAVGVLGLGTMILLLVVVVSRRAALNQLNASLAEVSNQLRELRRVRPLA